MNPLAFSACKITVRGGPGARIVHGFARAQASIDAAAARYVSGYFHTGDVGEVASHAWADAWLGPEDGWLSVDLTHRSIAGPGRCRLAVGRDYLDAAPVRGVRRGGGAAQMRVAVVVATSTQQQ